MKQISLRMEDELHVALTNEAKMLNKSLTQHILELVNKRGDLSKTNYNNKLQVRFNVTFLGDLLVMGRRDSFDAMYTVMKEAVKNGEIVILERHYENFPPTLIGEISSPEELEKWRDSILYISKR